MEWKENYDIKILEKKKKRNRKRENDDKVMESEYEQCRYEVTENNDWKYWRELVY